MKWLNIFLRRNFVKHIHHEDWLLTNDIPEVFISKWEHCCGRSPHVFVDAPPNTVKVEFTPKGLRIVRGLPIWKGTPFKTTIRISR